MDLVKIKPQLNDVFIYYDFKKNQFDLMLDIKVTISKKCNQLFDIQYICYQLDNEKYIHRSIFLIQTRNMELCNKELIKKKFLKKLEVQKKTHIDKRLKIYQYFDEIFPPIIDEFCSDTKTWDILRHELFNRRSI
jgi:hypothetical protein